MCAMALVGHIWQLFAAYADNPIADAAIARRSWPCINAETPDTDRNTEHSGDLKEAKALLDELAT
jgi:hypothetical protein